MEENFNVHLGKKLNLKEKKMLRLMIKSIKLYDLISVLQTQVCQKIKNLILIFGTKRVLFFGLKQHSIKLVTGNIGLKKLNNLFWSTSFNGLVNSKKQFF